VTAPSGKTCPDVPRVVDYTKDLLQLTEQIELRETGHNACGDSASHAFCMNRVFQNKNNSLKYKAISINTELAQALQRPLAKSQQISRKEQHNNERLA